MIGEKAALGNGHTVQKFVLLFVVAEGKLKVVGDHPLLVVPGSVAGQLSADLLLIKSKSIIININI